MVGTGLWLSIGKLITAVFSRARNPDVDRLAAKAAYAALRCEHYADMSVFLSAENTVHDMLCLAGAGLSGESRIQDVLSKVSAAQRTSYDAYRKRKLEDGNWSAAHDEDFAEFANDIDRVSIALPPIHDEPAGVGTKTAVGHDDFSNWTPPWEKTVTSTRKPGKTADPSHCWRWQFTGSCVVLRKADASESQLGQILIWF